MISFQTCENSLVNPCEIVGCEQG